MRFSKEEEKMLECRNWRAKPHLFIVRVGHHHSPSTYYFLCKSLALTEFYQKIGPIKVRGAYLITNCCSRSDMIHTKKFMGSNFQRKKCNLRLLKKPFFKLLSGQKMDISAQISAVYKKEI